MTPEQREKLLQILQDIQKTDNEVDNAYDTGLMVAAKESVYELWSKIDTDEILDSQTQQQLLEYLLAARKAISMSGGRSTEERAGRCMEQLGKVKRYIHSKLQ